MYFENHFSDVAITAADGTKATGIRRILLEHRFVYYIHLLSDMFNEVSKVSLIFQKEDITVPSAMLNPGTAMPMLSSKEDGDGFHTLELVAEPDGLLLYKNQHLRHQVPADALENQKRTIVQRMMTCIDESFENCQTHSMFLPCDIFDTTDWRDRDDLLINYRVK